ncbi:MAG: response regulator transcription factor [Bryobacteraceae bacterium]
MLSAEAVHDRTSILMIEDDPQLCELIRDYLDPHGFEVTFAHTGPAGLARVANSSFDAVLLDVMLPGMDGFEILRRIRAFSAIPVLMLTGRGEETDRIVGLEVGADDYIPKTLSVRELLARLRAVLRRSQLRQQAPPADLPIEIGPLVVDPAARAARVENHEIALTPAEFDLLLSLARACGRVKTREQLLQEVSVRDIDTTDRAIDMHVSSLRRKLGDDPRNPRYIQTIRATGYMIRRPESVCA